MDHFEWKINLVKSCHKNTDGQANNLRRKGLCFHREPANIGKIRDNLFLNRTIPLWNDLPFKVNDAKSLNSFKAELDGLGCSPLMLRVASRLLNNMYILLYLQPNLERLL